MIIVELAKGSVVGSVRPFAFLNLRISAFTKLAHIIGLPSYLVIGGDATAIN
jgi:hypothetical protein